MVRMQSPVGVSAIKLNNHFYWVKDISIWLYEILEEDVDRAIQCGFRIYN